MNSIPNYFCRWTFTSTYKYLRSIDHYGSSTCNTIIIVLPTIATTCN
jgi:hypothetical protein